MSLFLLKTSDVARCPKHILQQEHYSPDGSCQCRQAKGMTLRQKEEQAVALHKCPVCDANPGNACLHQNATRKIHWLKNPHPERVQLVDPSLSGYKKRAYRTRQVGAAGWQQSDSRSKGKKK
jgi:hypothetical protein